MNNMMTGNAVSDATSQPQMGGYGRGMNPRMGMGLGGFGSFGGFGGGNGMSFNAGGFGGYGGFGGFNPMMGYGGMGGFGGFNPMMGYGGMGGFGGFNPMMGYGGMGGFGGFTPMMAMGLGAFGGMGGGYGFNPMMGNYGGFGNQFDPRTRAQQQLQQMQQIPRDPFADQGVGVPSPHNQQAQPPQRYNPQMFSRPPMSNAPGLGSGGMGMSGLGGMLSPNDPMYGMPSAPPRMPVMEAGRDPAQDFMRYQQESRDWERKTGMTADQWYAKRDAAVDWRNKQAANAPAAPEPAEAVQLKTPNVPWY